MKDLDDWFNLTCTIKSDYWLYPYNMSRLDEYQILFDEYKNNIKQLSPKTDEWSDKKLALWFVSNCDTPSKREKYVRKMIQHVNISIFGSNGCQFKNVW